MATNNQINPVDVSKLKQGGTLNFPVDQYSTQWNLLNADSQNELSILNTLQPMMPQLFNVSADNKLTPNPDYLAGVTNSTVDGKQVTKYELNPKAKWSDGTPITWNDFKANWTVQSGKNSKYNATTTSGYSQIASVVQGKDQFEAIVTYTSPYADWQGLFLPFYPASQMTSVDAFNNSYKGKIPLTAGPFKLGSMNPTTKVVSEVPDPNWWGAKPVLSGINFRTLDAASEPGAFASGEIDLTDIGPQPSAYKAAKGVAGSSIRIAGAPNLRQMLLNGQSPLLTDQNVRQAIFSAINRTAMGQSDLSGLPWAIKPLNNHFLVNNANGYKDNAGALGTYDLAGAKAKLAAAGWTAGSDGILAKGGKKLELSMVIPAGTPIATNEANLTTSMLKAVGIKVDTVVKDSDSFFPDVNAGKFDITVFSGIGAIPYFPISNSQASFQSPVKGNIGQNFSRLGSPEVDSDMAKAATDLDPTQYLTDVNAADTALWQLAVNLPLFQRPQIVGTKATLANYGAFGFQSTDWTKVGFTK
ncbi:ABC transporter family substrate-binding protein [Streptacidiphilus sp. PAMC 29251]